MLLLTDLDKEAWLVEVADTLAISSLEVLGDAHLSVIPQEGGVRRRVLERHIFDIVGALVAPVSNDRLPAKLQSDHLLELIVAGGITLDLADALKAGRRRHELEDVVNCERASKLRLECGGLEA